MKKFYKAVLALTILSLTLPAGAFAAETPADADTYETEQLEEQTANEYDAADDLTDTDTYEEEQPEDREAKVYAITLSEAIDMAYEDNAQLEANELEQYGNEISLKSANTTMRSYRNVVVNVSSSFEAYCLKNGYYVEAAEMALRLSQSENEKIRASIAYDVTEAYYNLVLMQKLTAAAENSYNLALDNMTVVDAEAALGMIPNIDYQNAELTVAKCKNALDTYKLQMQIAENNLKILLNKDEENCRIIPTDEIECEYYSSDVTADIEAAMNTRYDVNALKEQRDLAEKYFDMSSALTDHSATYNTAYASFMKADYNYTHNSKLIALSIQSGYNNILTSEANMETARQTYEIKLLEYESSKLKYELGMITNLDLTSSINDLYSAQVSYANAKLTYRLAVEKYKYEITIGL